MYGYGNECTRDERENAREGDCILLLMEDEYYKLWTKICGLSTKNEHIENRYKPVSNFEYMCVLCMQVFFLSLFVFHSLFHAVFT